MHSADTQPIPLTANH